MARAQTVILATLNLKRDWVRNLLKNHRVELEINGTVFTGEAKQVAYAKQLCQASWIGVGPEGAFAVTMES